MALPDASPPGCDTIRFPPKATRAAATQQNISYQSSARPAGAWSCARGSPVPQSSLVGPVRMTESFTGPVKTLARCPAAFGPLSTCVAPPLASRSAPGEALQDSGGADRLHGSRRGGGACFSTVLDSLQFSDESQQIRGRKEGILS